MLSMDAATALLQEIDATAVLKSRAVRSPNWRAEAEALEGLIDVFVHQPERLAQTLVDTALALTAAEAAGISIEEIGSKPAVFRWVATAGSYTCYANGTMPRNFSPCGEVISRNAPVLMRHMSKLYDYVSELHAPPHEVLLVPFHRAGVPIGTVWIVLHDDARGFDAEDLRIVKTLTRFAAAAVESTGKVRSLTVANRALQEADTRKEHFMASLAHEMRNPLGAVSLGLQLLKRPSDTGERRNATLESMERQVAHLTALVRDMTDVAAVRTGKLALDIGPVSVQGLIANALETCCELMHAKNQHLDVNVPEAPVIVHGDAVRLTQVLINLLNNAIKYTPTQGVIAIQANRGMQGTEISITDSGVGLDPLALSKVFDLYMQVPMDRRPLDSGLGIGLALAKQLVELHRGQLTVASEGLGKGSTFKVILPLGTQ